LVSIEDIRQAIVDLPVEELSIYLHETIWEGIEDYYPGPLDMRTWVGGEGDDLEMSKIKHDAMVPFIHGADREETREGHAKLKELIGELAWKYIRYTFPEDEYEQMKAAGNIAVPKKTL
jgi:hypothetical protein